MILFKERIQRLYGLYLADYKCYLDMRGYNGHLNDWVFVKRGFLECWFEPGFHRFWQQWNPGIGYFAYKAYVLFGGSRRKDRATIAAFVLNGLIHNLVVSLLLWNWDFPLPFTFLSFGIFTVGFRWLETKVKLGEFPKMLHLVVNCGLVFLSFEFGFAICNFIR